MQHTTRPLLTLALAALLGLASAAAPTSAAAQGKGQKNGHVRHKNKGHNDFERGDRNGGDGRVFGAGRSDRDDDGWGDYRIQDDQERRRSRRGNAGRVPPGHMPPAGMCRIWIDGVPPGRQPAPTDCATAERNRPSNARVIYGAESGGSVSRRPLRDRTIVRLDPSCADVNGDGRRERVTYIVDGRVARMECR